MSFNDRTVAEAIRHFRHWLRGCSAATSSRNARRRKQAESRAAEILEQRICLFQNYWGELLVENKLEVTESFFSTHSPTVELRHPENAVHDRITEEGLSFLQPNVVSQIIGGGFGGTGNYSGNLGVDTTFLFNDHIGRYLPVPIRPREEQHFDDCLFAEGAANINSLYEDALSYADPVKFQSEKLADVFGQILHPAQDFYAHSNWVNLGKTTLIDDGLNLWDAFTPYSIREGVVLVEGDLPSGVVLGVNRETFAVTVHRSGEPLRPGLISGVYDEVQSRFPQNGLAFVPHDDEGVGKDINANYIANEAGLNKDSSDRPLFLEARTLAVAQTAHEFDRLFHLVQTKYGEAGAAKLRSEWTTNYEFVETPRDQTLGSEFLVNTTTDGGPVGFFHGGLYPTSGSQFAVRLASDADGNYGAVWQGPNREGGGTFDVFVQRFDAKGRRLGTESVVNSDWSGEQTNPDVAMAPGGHFVVVYEQTADDQAAAQFDSLTSIYARLFDSEGTPMGDSFPVATAPSRRWAPGVGMANDGAFVVTWTGQSSDGLVAGMYARRFDSSGTALGNEFKVNTTPLNSQVLQVSNSMAMNAAGEFVVVWSNFGPDGSDQGVFGQRFNPLGERVGGEFRVNTTTFDSQLTPRVAMDDLDRFMVTWNSRLQDGSGWGAYAQRFAADGTPAGPEFLVTNTTQGEQGVSDIAVDSGGRYLIAWNGTPFDNAHNGTDLDVYVRQFAADGTPLGDEIRVNQTTTSTQLLPAVTFGKDGRYFVAWASLDQDGAGYGVYGRVAGAKVRELVFTSDATIVVPENSRELIRVTATDADQPEQPLSLSYSIIGGADRTHFGITTDGTLSFLAAPDFENPADHNADNIYVVQVQANDGTGGITSQMICVKVSNVAETNVEVSLPPFGGYFTVMKLGENLHVVGPSISDVIAPVRFDDVASLLINGSSSKDTVKLDVSFAGYGGSFRFDGGSGADKLDASRIDFAVTMDGAAGNDTLLGGRGDDVFFGGTGNDRAVGDAGNDVLTGGPGNDSLFGELGRDTLVEVTSGNFSLTNSLLNGNGLDMIRDFEHAVLIGSGGDNVIVASGFRTGSVKLNGLGGNDTLIGTSFDDSLDGGDGIDTIKQSAATNLTLADSRLLGSGDDVLNSIERAELTVFGAIGRVVDASSFSGRVTIKGGDGADTILGSQGSGLLLGNGGNDSIIGGRSSDTILGGNGNDQLSGGADADTLIGGLGDDTLDGGDGTDRLAGGTGSNRGRSNRDVFIDPRSEINEAMSVFPKWLTGA